ncbi:MAG: hypothetical protein FWF44_04040 [Defluviitaleaceae bacterium]|nr:hypothetical protein [Defluviitaleaceae bacterium]
MDTVVTGIIALIGVLVGSAVSLLIAVYSNKRDYQARISDKQQAVSVEVLINIDELFSKLPIKEGNFAQLNEFLATKYIPEANPKLFAEIRLYLPIEMRQCYEALFAEAKTFLSYQEDRDVMPLITSMLEKQDEFIRTMKGIMRIPHHIKKRTEKKIRKRYRPTKSN